MKQVKIYVRGICKNTGRYQEIYEGRAIVVLEYLGKYKQIRLQEQNTTANRMILKGVVAGLEKLKEPCEVIVYVTTALGFRKPQKSPNKDLLGEVNRLIAEGGHMLEVVISRKYQEELIQLLKD